jgi:hypothetical protein
MPISPMTCWPDRMKALNTRIMMVAAAVLLDAFLLRTLLVPALAHLSGRANWWLPGWLDRILPHLSIEPAQSASRGLPSTSVHDLAERPAAGIADRRQRPVSQVAK